MRSKLWAMTARTPSRAVPLAAQSRLLPVPYSRPASTIERHALAGVLHGRLVNGGLGALGQVQRDPALGARCQAVAQPHVGEGAAHHHLVVAAPRSVGVEVLSRHTVLGEVAPGRRGRADGAGGGDVVGGHAVAHHGQHPRVGDVGDRGRRHRHGLEERWVLDIGGVVLPRVRLAASGRHLLPVLVAVEDGAVAGAEHLRRQRGADRLADLLHGGPQLGEEDRVALGVGPPSGSVVRSRSMVPASA